MVTGMPCLALKLGQLWVLVTVTTMSYGNANKHDHNHSSRDHDHDHVMLMRMVTTVMMTDVMTSMFTINKSQCRFNSACCTISWS